MQITLSSELLPDDSAEDIFHKILKSRGYKTAKQQQEFLKPLYPTLELLRAELDIKKSTLAKTTKIIQDAISNGEQICIYGDYDADGVTATAILWQTLVKMGAKVMPFIPHREKHGYGMSQHSLDEIISGEAFKSSPLHPFIPSLVITVDNGIVAHSEVKYLKDKGLKVIVTDHHKEDGKELIADALVYSTGTSGAGIAGVLSLHLLKESSYANNLIDIATIGIVADQIPLTGINRNIVVHGLKALSNTKNIGLQELYKSAELLDKNISVYDINFIIAPRINAMGRLDHALEALRLLCVNASASAIKLAKTLTDTNKKRQDITFQAIDQARTQVEDAALVIVSSAEFHEGVIGLVAGKLVEESGKPAIAISVGKKIAKGSARSINGIDITSLLRKMKHHLISVGGHKMAAGFSLDVKNLKVFTQEISTLASQIISAKSLKRTLSVESELTLSQVTKKLYLLLHAMEPHGIGNPRPKFVTKNFDILEERLMGSKKQHVKLTISQNNQTQELVWFNFNQEKDFAKLKEIVYTININSWRGKDTIQLILNHAN